MILRVIQIGPEERAALEKLTAHAEANPVTKERFERMRNGEEGPIGEDKAHRLELPGGLRLVLSLEEQPSGLVRHASFSVFPREPDALPSHGMVDAVMPLLGFKRPLLESDLTWVEGNVAVNVLQLETQSSEKK